MSFQLTKNQHIIPAVSIARFYGNEGMVWVKHRKKSVPFQANARNKAFCAKRVWEEKSEKSHRTIENSFQEIAEEINVGSLKALTQGASDCISEMFALWIVRSKLADQPLGRTDKHQLGFPATIEPAEWTPDERDELEEEGFVVSDPNGSIPGRMQAWPLMRRQIAQISAALRGVKWGILKADDGEFLLPDRFLRHCFLPLSPDILLAARHEDGKISGEDIARVNAIAMTDCREWIVARSRFQF